MKEVELLQKDDTI